jgi:glycosyltransferase involved in cell wall biosynthesis
MITRNEEEYLEQCLNSVKDIVDEIIIVDTGSTDKTKEIAKKFGAKIYDFKWIDDFSAARNESLKHATKDWILVLDADEVIEKSSFSKITELVNSERDAFILPTYNHTNDTKISGFTVSTDKGLSKGCAGFFISAKCRIFRNRKNYGFTGAVHELVEPSIGAGNGRVEFANIIIHNYGNMDNEIIKKKRKMYLELCRKKVKQNPADSSYYELGVLCKENDDFENAVKSFRKAVELNPNHNMALYELGVICEQQKNYDEAVKYYTESLKIKENSESFQSLGVCYLKKGMHKEAYRNLVKAMMLNPNKYTIYNNLGAVLEKSGNLDTARQMLEVAVKLNPDNVIGFYNLGVVLDKKGSFGEAINAYEKAAELGHNKSEEIKKRVKQLKTIINNLPSYKYGFRVGG